MPSPSLSRRFYQRRPEIVARALLGKILVHGARSGLIVETEAYLGPEDRASHARFGKTARNRVMFGLAGISYVYLCYGMYDMFNIVAGPDGVAGAVLVRALAPVAGIDGDASAARGPGRLCRALGITRGHGGLDLVTHDSLYVTAGRRLDPAAISVGARIGVAYAAEWAAAPLRFWITGHPAVSVQPRRARRTA